MLCYIYIFTLLLSLVSSETNYELKRTDSSYALYMKSDEYKNNVGKNEGVSDLSTENGFYIAKLENKNSGDLTEGKGSLTITIKKNDSQENENKATINCTVMDLSSFGQGIALFCPNNDEYDSIEFTPEDSDTIKIEGIAQIKFGLSTATGNNGSPSIMENGKYMVLLLALILFI